jgi:hypothetical protein
MIFFKAKIPDILIPTGQHPGSEFVVVDEFVVVSPKNDLQFAKMIPKKYHNLTENTLKFEPFQF